VHLFVTKIAVEDIREQVQVGIIEIVEVLKVLNILKVLKILRRVKNIKLVYKCISIYLRT
jgi:hypothetical protein